MAESSYIESNGENCSKVDENKTVGKAMITNNADGKNVVQPLWMINRCKSIIWRKLIKFVTEQLQIVIKLETKILKSYRHNRCMIQPPKGTVTISIFLGGSPK
jgi:hypothetical protein